MRKFACLGLVVMMAMGMAGCSDSGKMAAPVETSAEPQESQQQEAVQSVAPVDENSTAALTNEDFKPFFEKLYSFTEEEFNSLNQNRLTTQEGYFDNLKSYRETMNKAFKEYLSDETLDQLNKQSIKLDFDLPKKSQINDYVADAAGTVKDVEVKSMRELDDQYVFEVDVTTENKVIPYNEFAETYVWDDNYGYYTNETEKEGVWKNLKRDTSDSYIYAEGENVSDYIKLVNTYWVYVLNEKQGGKFKVCGLKQGGNFSVNRVNNKRIDNTDYITRVPYYEEPTEKQTALLQKVMKQMMAAPRDVYDYYEMISDHSFELINNFWNDMGLADAFSVKENTYKSAFEFEFIPYKASFYKIMADDTRMKVKTSIYSTQLQPGFIVSLPAEVINKDNTNNYYIYKYYIAMENDKIESIQLIRLDEVTVDDFKKFGTPEEEAEQTEETTDQADNAAEQTEETPTEG